MLKVRNLLYGVKFWLNFAMFKIMQSAWENILFTVVIENFFYILIYYYESQFEVATHELTFHFIRLANFQQDGKLKNRQTFK